MFETNLKCTLLREGEKPQVRTARGVLSYPNVFEPSTQDSEDGSTKVKYGTTHVYPVNVDLSVLQEACYAVAASAFGSTWKTKFPNLGMPWKKTTDLNRNGVPHYEKIGVDPKVFPTFLRCASYASFGKPVVVNHRGEHLNKEDHAELIYPGRWALITVQPYPYGDAKSMNKGISLGFEGVQLMEDGEPLTARRLPADQMFEAVSVSESADAMFKE